jgi:hypothetical protein
MPEVTVPPLSPSRVAFMTRCVSMTAGSCRPGGIPSVVRAYGCKVARDRRAVSVFVATAHSHSLLEDLRAGAGIAVVFSRPSSHETLQLKGLGALILPLGPGDRARMRAYAASFRDELAAIGWRDEFNRAITAGAELDALALLFVPVAAFDQTPGPAAGHPLAVEGA